jgi:hypothetical protein
MVERSEPNCECRKESSLRPALDGVARRQKRAIISLLSSRTLISAARTVNSIAYSSLRGSVARPRLTQDSLFAEAGAAISSSQELQNGTRRKPRRTTNQRL